MPSTKAFDKLLNGSESICHLERTVHEWKKMKVYRVLSIVSICTVEDAPTNLSAGIEGVALVFNRIPGNLILLVQQDHR